MQKAGWSSGIYDFMNDCFPLLTFNACGLAVKNNECTLVPTIITGLRPLPLKGTKKNVNTISFLHSYFYVRYLDVFGFLHHIAQYFSLSGRAF